MKGRQPTIMYANTFDDVNVDTNGFYVQLE
jgi:hypothetical protein